jgi:hypothetical protein
MQNAIKQDENRIYGNEVFYDLTTKPILSKYEDNYLSGPRWGKFLFFEIDDYTDLSVITSLN